MIQCRTFFGRKKKKIIVEDSKHAGEVDVDGSGFAVGGIFSTLSKKAASLENAGDNHALDNRKNVLEGSGTAREDGRARY